MAIINGGTSFIRVNAASVEQGAEYPDTCTKVYLRYSLPDGVAEELFRREVLILNYINRKRPGLAPNVISSNSAELSITMEYLEGYVTLDKYLNEVLLQGENFLPKFQQLVNDVAVALEQLANIGIIHGDIKPANIMVDPKTGNVKLIDFGTAMLEVEEYQTPTEDVVSTPQIVAPEIKDTKQGVPHLTDIYSFAKMLEIWILKKGLAAQFSINLHGVLDLATAINPYNREYKTATEFAEAFARCCVGPRLVAMPVGVPAEAFTLTRII